MYITHHFILFYISTKYHQNIPKGIQVTEWTRSFTPMLTPMGSIPKTICPPPSCRVNIIMRKSLSYSDYHLPKNESNPINGYRDMTSDVQKVLILTVLRAIIPGAISQLWRNYQDIAIIIYPNYESNPINGFKDMAPVI